MCPNRDFIYKLFPERGYSSAVNFAFLYFSSLAFILNVLFGCIRYFLRKKGKDGVSEPLMNCREALLCVNMLEKY